MSIIASKLTLDATASAIELETFTVKDTISVGIASFNAVQPLSSVGPHVPSLLHFLITFALARKPG